MIASHRRSADTDQAIQLAKPGERKRLAAEQFVRAGFLQNYGAVIHSFMPALVTLGQPSIKAVMGVRPATQRLSVEQYLNQPIEKALAGKAPGRAHIVEVGNLVSANRHSTLTLFMVVTSALYGAGYRHMVFCATAKVAAILRRVGAQMQRIVEADGRRVGDSLAQWGRYYDHNPTVMHLDLHDALSLINSSPLLRKYCSPHTNAIADIAQALQYTGCAPAEKVAL